MKFETKQKYMDLNSATKLIDMVKKLILNPYCLLYICVSPRSICSVLNYILYGVCYDKST